MHLIAFDFYSYKSIFTISIPYKDCYTKTLNMRQLWKTNPSDREKKSYCLILIEVTNKLSKQIIKKNYVQGLFNQLYLPGVDNEICCFLCLRLCKSCTKNVI